MILMPKVKDCHTSTSGGKGNEGMFMVREPRICAAGLPTAQASVFVKDSLEHYLLKDEADALISDAIIPDPKPRPLPPLRKPMPKDLRNIQGPCGQVADLINPPKKSRFRQIAEDLKETSYSSYWNKQLGKVRDAVPMFPDGFDIIGTTYGKPTKRDDLYDVIMPRDPVPDKTPPSKEPSYQTDRKYCAPAYNPDHTFGYRTFVDKRGRYAKCCVSDDRISLGKGNIAVLNSIQSNFLAEKQPRLAQCLTPNENIRNVPEGHAFGKLSKPDSIAECLIFCEFNEGLVFMRKCLKHLNTLRKSLRVRFLPHFFQTFYLQLKYFDTEKTGWLPKDTVYKYCGTKLIRFDPVFIEPLLSMWNAFDGEQIEYKTFVHIINYREPSPEMPRVLDVRPECLDFDTTYRDMVKPKPPDLSRMAGLPSGRYFDLDYPLTPEKCCKADRTCLPQESDVRSCLNPSLLTKLFVNHRDMYAKRDPSVVRRVFEAMNESKFTDEEFDKIWEEAQKLHSQGWVCYETFRQAMDKLSEKKTEIKSNNVIL